MAVVALIIVSGLMVMSAAPAMGATNVTSAPHQLGTTATLTGIPQIATSCGFSQVWEDTAINGWGLYPCDGVYINCWAWGSGGILYDWVSWTSRYGYDHAPGYVPDDAIETYNETLSYWNQC